MGYRTDMRIQRRARRAEARRRAVRSFVVIPVLVFIAYVSGSWLITQSGNPAPGTSCSSPGAITVSITKDGAAHKLRCEPVAQGNREAWGFAPATPLAAAGPAGKGKPAVQLAARGLGRAGGRARVSPYGETVTGPVIAP